MKCDYCGNVDMEGMDLTIGKMRGASFMGFKSGSQERNICIDCLIKVFDMCLGKPGDFVNFVDTFSKSEGLRVLGES